MSDIEQFVAVGKTVPVKRLSRRKRWLFRAGLMLLFIGALELASIFTWIFFPPLPLEFVPNTQRTVAELGTERTKDLEVLHPYLGWVFNPDAGRLSTNPQKQIEVNSLGFSDADSSIQHRSPERIVIGFFGGSVAQQMSTLGEQVFRDRLSASPIARGREIHIVRLAMSGYKQPQQLMALNYVLALGAEFDVVVNIDGYNETGLVVGENDGHRVFAAYPRAWHARLQDVVDPRNSAISYRLLQIRATRQAWAQWIVESILCRSWTANLVWAVQDARLQQQQLELGLELKEHFVKRGHGFARQGPRQLYSDEDGMYEHLAELWRNCSLQMHDLCSARGIRYLHFLQPNQYHAGSKPLSPHELERCYASTQEHAQAVTKGYPRLIAAGRGLQESGVLFHDSTGLFANETDTIYSDYFCHYNSRGTNMLAETVAEKVLEALSQSEHLQK